MTHAPTTPPHGVRRLRASRRHGDTAEFEADPRQVVTLTPEELRRCHDFAREEYPTSRHMFDRRAQTNAETVVRQIYEGKAGELGARRFLTALGLECGDVDFVVREAPGKTYDADLLCAGSRLHVKTQHVARSREHGLSWIFQFGGAGAGHKDRAIFDQPDDPDQFAVFCQLNEPRVVVCATPAVASLHRHRLFQEPRADALRGIKKAVYYDPLVSALTREELWAFVLLARQPRV